MIILCLLFLNELEISYALGWSSAPLNVINVFVLMMHALFQLPRYKYQHFCILLMIIQMSAQLGIQYMGTQWVHNLLYESVEDQWYKTVQ